MDAGRGTYAAYKTIREKVPFLEQDRVLSTDIKVVVDMIQSNEILNEVEKAIGTLRLSFREQKF
jgi:histidine ammonia-lyase